MTSRPAILAICGSQRRASFNRMLMRTAMDALSAHADCTALDWQDIPPFDADALEAQGLPAPVLRVREAIARADGVLLVTPEYNFSLPGMLKNTLDWVSRGSDQPFARKPVVLLSATTGPLGGARVQNEARRVLLFLNAMVLQKPEIYVGNAASKFDAQGHCTDAVTQGFVADQMTAFVDWIARVQRMNAAG